MSALLLALFAAAALLALSSMAVTVRRYAGTVLALGELEPPPPRPLGRRRIASRSRVRTPRRALVRGRQALGNPRRGMGAGPSASPPRFGHRPSQSVPGAERL